MKSLNTLVKGAYGGISPTVWVLSLTQLINRSGTMVIFFLAVYLKDELGFSLEQTGFTMAIFGIGTQVGVYTGGRLIDKIGYYPILLSSLVVGGAMFLVVSNIHNFAALCVGLFFLSAFGEAFRPANMAAISYYSTPENYTRSISLNRLAINLGFAIGPAVGGFLATKSYSWIFYADGLTCLLAALIVVFFVQNKFSKKAHEELKASTPHRSPYKDRPFQFFLILVAIYAIAFFQLFSTMPLYYKEVEHMTETEIGWLMAFNGLIVAAVEMILIYKLEKKWSVYNFIVLGSVLLVLSYLMLLFLHGVQWLYVIMIVISFSEMFAMPFFNTYMNSRSGAANKGQYSSLYIMAWSSAQILTPIVATQVISFGGYNSLFVVLSGFAIVVIAGMKWLERKDSKHEHTPEKIGD